MSEEKWNIVNPSGRWRMIVTRELPGRSWLNLLLKEDFRVEISIDDRVPIKTGSVHSCEVSGRTTYAVRR